MNKAEKIIIFDTTLRDGEQSPGCSMTLDEKVRFAKQLEKLGVNIIEAGFAIASDGDFAAIQAVAAECRETKIASLCRTVEADIRRAADSLKYAVSPRIHTFVATSDIHLEYKLKKSRAEVLQMVYESVSLARELCADVEFSAEDATRSDVGFLCEAFSIALETGATTLNVPDTVGYTTPWEIYELIKTVKERVVKNRTDITISTHCHNDLGLAVANSLAAVNAGARQIECTINGIGERAGNAALEEIIMALRVRADKFEFENSVNSQLLFPTSQMLCEMVSFGVQPNKAIVGRNAFAHEAGIHQHGVLSNPLCYEIMTPESVGVASNNIVLGKHSGRHALNQRFVELGYELSKAEIDETYKNFTQLADRKKKIYDQDLIGLLPLPVTKTTVNNYELIAA
ncbi:MAG: 2-isopropylmalate synthase [Acidobacteriota bacterium]|nr:2-isopropylmalate synthase [Acidobacteriota bacterium]